ncbi:hypothetical protein BN970_01962 [Mycolicibacterium conceptionense]|uniref:Uncharacterized protein n=1 Tax=Mycolicibacterium conceptionense TaxID=451644 RepID=A0A0U1DAI8_9MYCO|nr:hypothetical protein BN970_01962 [Mycolicibacterium conceptionense]
MPAQRGRQLEALGVDAVQGLADRVERVHFDHEVNQTGIAQRLRGTDGQAVMALVDAHEPDPNRAELRWHRDAERAAGLETQYLGVELEQAIDVERGQHHMPEPLIAGDELGSVRRDHRRVVEDRAVEHLQRGAGRILERDDFFHPARVGLLQ